MKEFLTIYAILIAGSGLTQITITETDFPAPGDTVMISQSDETTLDLVTTGASSTWDFSSINISAQAIDTFHAVSSAGILYQLIFNNTFDNPDHVSDYYNDWFGGGLGQASQFGLNIDAPVQFTAVQPDRVENTGIGFEVQGTGIPGKSDTIDIQYELPMDYSDSWISNSYTNLDLNPTFDAIYRRYQYRNSIVDGWGTITTPFDTFDVIRVKSLVQAVDSFYIGFISSWVELPTPDQIEYQWFANGQKTPVFEVITTDIGGNETITSISFKDKPRTFASTVENTFDGAIYPNPSNDFMTIQLVEPANEISVFELSGKQIYSQIPTSTLLQIDVKDWDAGMYILKVSDSKGISSVKFVVE